MRVNPGESTLVLTSESDLERDAMRRWAGCNVAVEEWLHLSSGGYAQMTLALRGAPAPSLPGPPAHGDNVVTAPSRRVRVPWPGQRVDVKSGDVRFGGKVARIEIDPIAMAGDVWVHVVSDHGRDDGAYPPEEVTPIGDDPRWVEIVLPEEE